MNKRTIAEQIKQANDGKPFITREQLAKVMGHPDAHTVDKFLRNLAKVNKRYLVVEVAEEIAKQQKY